MFYRGLMRKCVDMCTLQQSVVREALYASIEMHSTRTVPYALCLIACIDACMHACHSWSCIGCTWTFWLGSKGPQSVLVQTLQSHTFVVTLHPCCCSIPNQNFCAASCKKRYSTVCGLLGAWGSKRSCSSGRRPAPVAGGRSCARLLEFCGCV